MCVCICVVIRVPVLIRVCAYVLLFMCVFISMCVCVCVCVWKFLSVFVYMSIHGICISFVWCMSVRSYVYVRGSLNKFLGFFRMGTFIDSTHMKLLSPSK